MDSMFLVLRTGMQWNALNATGVRHSSPAHRRFQEWERAGVFHETGARWEDVASSLRSSSTGAKAVYDKEER